MAIPIEQMAAESFSSQQAINGTSQLFGPIIEAIKPVIGTFSAIVGGLFGLYLIFIIARLYYERKKVKLLRDMKYDLDYLNQHFNLPYSSEKKFRKKVLTLSEHHRRKKEKEKKRKEKEARKNGRSFLLFFKR